MPKDNLISFFDRETTPDFDGNIEYQNPKLFNWKVPAYATHYCTDREDIASVFEEKGVKRYEVQSKGSASDETVDSRSTSGKPESSSVDEAGIERAAGVDSSVSGDVNGLQQEERQEQKEEVDWRDLSWPQMRAKAASLSDEPIISKAKAQEVLERNLG